MKTVMGNCLKCYAALNVDPSNLDVPVGQHDVFNPRTLSMEPCCGDGSVREAIWSRIYVLRRDNFITLGNGKPFYDESIKHLVEVAGEPPR